MGRGVEGGGLDTNIYFFHFCLFLSLVNFSIFSILKSFLGNNIKA